LFFACFCIVSGFKIYRRFCLNLGST
jgi:hypothetical protein